MLLAGGGTGGHVSPLLAVAEVLSERDPHVRFLFVGGRRGREAEIALAAGIPFHATVMPSLRDPDSRLSLVARAVLLPVALIDALWRVGGFRPSVCLTTGGLVSIPVVLAAALWRVPILIWTGDVIPGRANRMLARTARRVATTFEEARAYLPRDKVVLTGNPVRGSLLRWDRERGRAHFGLPPSGPVVLVTGGSQGSAAINDAVLAALPALLDRAHVMHHTGEAQLARAEARRAALPAASAPRYRPFAYLRDDMGAAIAAADVVIGRASSSSIAEPLALGVPLVLIPFRAAAEAHQEGNARAIEETGAAAVIRESELSVERLIAVVVGLLNDPLRLERMRSAAAKAGRPAAAADLAREVMLLGGCG